MNSKNKKEDDDVKSDNVNALNTGDTNDSDEFGEFEEF